VPAEASRRPTTAVFRWMVLRRANILREIVQKDGVTGRRLESNANRIIVEYDNEFDVSLWIQ
jgi:hypothetical protein